MKDELTIVCALGVADKTLTQWGLSAIFPVLEGCLLSSLPRFMFSNIPFLPPCRPGVTGRGGMKPPPLPVCPPLPDFLSPLTAPPCRSQPSEHLSASCGGPSLPLLCFRVIFKKRTVLLPCHVFVLLNVFFF